MVNLRALSYMALAFSTGVYAVPAAASSTTSSAAAATTTAYTKAADNKIFAQQLVYDILAKHDDLIVVGIHGVIPGHVNGSMIATNLDRIGEPDDSDDDAVAVDHKTILAPNLSDPTRFEIATPLFDAAGNMLNVSMNMVFKYTAGDDQLALHSKAVDYRKEFSRRVISFNILLQPISAFNVSCKCYFLLYPA